uniref:Uncharacterized protein n=1 Tax=Oryza meridionalis TaxID=40149 RepID=A0A0E0C5W3_9ORYZ
MGDTRQRLEEHFEPEEMMFAVELAVVELAEYCIAAVAPQGAVFAMLVTQPAEQADVTFDPGVEGTILSPG